MKDRDKQASIDRTMELYLGKLALLREWEECENPDPDEIRRLTRLVKYHHSHLVAKGALCPNEI